MAKSQRVAYTVKEVEQYQQRMHRQHAAEMVEIRDEAYNRGYADGRREIQNEMRLLLGLPLVVVESI